MTKYKKVTPEIAAQLQAIVGAKRFFAGDAVKDLSLIHIFNITKNDEIRQKLSIYG